MRYIGRFAPSPTGPLHFGSLLAALASYADARAHGGLWHLRIEDLDPPREQPGASALILSTLEAFGFDWDGEVIYQSQRGSLYRDAVEQLQLQHQAYRCNCSRKQVFNRTGGIRYDGHCHALQPPHGQACAIRAHCAAGTIELQDAIQATQRYSLARDHGDFVIRRRDGLFAYQLAVVVDDAAQQISHVVRGSDLLDETPCQIQLQRYLGYASLDYAHIPVATSSGGQKLSKQNHAPPLDARNPVPALIAALEFLGQEPDAALHDASARELLHWAVEHWSIASIPRTREIPWSQP
ncbi:tRNA glutamyl-Q(34) synthetase GluQRS [Marinobacterium rhizophilum]|uniref:Glutamyl-Q tRNA(Asp) synthetase n=1 Tax=Marinobacterium rhizophilum TaxID=420402 RepID=A0ABY5HG15_9GAMM|nr:tRNA glutamyl-Q(34) synthetase GluQRS [Marinobacterium rhizophilum]UTW10904.1 tRNA glutamyl-Q(34) synthetase GluQRS [Marinobacterium rhizophilum]